MPLEVEDWGFPLESERGEGARDGGAAAQGSGEMGIGRGGGNGGLACGSGEMGKGRSSGVLSERGELMQCGVLRALLWRGGTCG